MRAHNKRELVNKLSFLEWICHCCSFFAHFVNRVVSKGLSVELLRVQTQKIIGMRVRYKEKVIDIQTGQGDKRIRA